MLDIPFGTTEIAAVRRPTVVIDITSGGGDDGGLLGAVADAVGLSGDSADPWRASLESLTLECALLPGVDVVTILLANNSRAPEVAVGDSGTIAFGYGDETELAFTGQIDTVRRQVAGALRVTLVNGAAQLARRRLDMSFQDQTAGEIVEALLGSVESESSIAAETVEDGITYPFCVVAGGRTLLQQIADLAQRSGHVAYFLPNGNLAFVAPSEEDAAHEFRFGQDIIALHVEERSATVNGVLATGEGAAGSSGADAWSWLVKDPSNVQAKAGDGQPQAVIQDGGLRSSDSAETAANAGLAAQVTLAGHIVAAGAPTVAVGSTITIADAPNDAHNGSFFVRRVKHRFDNRHGFQTDLWFSQLAGGRRLAGWFTVMSDLYETIRYIVRQEIQRARTAELAVVQEQHPHADDGDSDNYACSVVLRNSQIVLSQVPVATARIGQAAIPNVGDLVLVQFVGGDINAPVIVGSFYNDEDRPPANDDGQLVWHLPTVGGDVQLTVDGHSKSVVLALGGGVEINVADADPAVEIKVGNGSATVQIDSDGTITINSQKAINIESMTDIALKGLNINVEASAQLVLKGTQVQIN